VENAAQKAVAEFMGTFALTFIGAGAVVITGAGLSDAGLLGVALAHGIVLAVMVSVLGHISGAHFNPAVTAAVWATGNIRTLMAGLYVLVQLAAAIVAALALTWVIPESIRDLAPALGSPAVGAGVSEGGAVIIEALLTMFLVFVVFGTAVDDRGAFEKIAGLPIGLVLVFDILMGGPLTGAAMNPARGLGPMIVSGEVSAWWVYVVGAIGGGIIGAGIYWFAFLGGREKVVAAPKTERPIGGGPESDQELVEE
jgi:MIP family channel proteins